MLGALALALALAAPISPPALQVDGPSPGSHRGASIAGAGDVNGDGRQDVVIGSPLGTTGSPACAGTVHVLFGPFTDDSSGGFITTGAVVGDANGDGRDDVLAGVRVADHNDRPDWGAGYLFFNP